MKQCGTCKHEKALEDFPKNKGGKFGRHSNCRTCFSTRARRYYLDNRERLLAQSLEYQKNNPEVRKAKYKKYRETHPDRYRPPPEQMRERQKQYRRRNPHVSVHQTNMRRAAKARALPLWADKSEIAAIYARCREITATTGIAHEVDHFYPLRGETVCGLHCPANLRIITAKQNRSKYNQIPESAVHAPNP